LRKLQGADGKWPHPHIGATALAGLTLLVCDVEADDPAVQRAAQAVRHDCPALSHTYSIALAILFLDRLADPDDTPLIESLTVRLLAGQIQASGDWTYSCPAPNDAEVRRLKVMLDLRGRGIGRRDAPLGKRTVKNLPQPIQEQLLQIQRGVVGPPGQVGDKSNTQFATLGLWVGRRYGLPVDGSLRLAEAGLRACQNADGGWGYVRSTEKVGGSTPSMTCAGLFGLAMGRATRAKYLRAKPRDLSKDVAVRRGLLALSTVIGQPLGERPLLVEQSKTEQGNGRVYYCLWALARLLPFLAAAPAQLL
jgi:hypothetical protein